MSQGNRLGEHNGGLLQPDFSGRGFGRLFCLLRFIGM